VSSRWQGTAGERPKHVGRGAWREPAAADNNLQRAVQAELHVDPSPTSTGKPGSGCRWRRKILVPSDRRAATRQPAMQKPALSAARQHPNSTSQVPRAMVGVLPVKVAPRKGSTMATIRVSCRSCPASALLTPEQILLVHLRGWGSYLFVCPECGRVTDAPAGPDHMLLRRPPPASHSPPAAAAKPEEASHDRSRAAAVGPGSSSPRYPPPTSPGTTSARATRRRR
jgi:hypothetical protein